MRYFWGFSLQLTQELDRKRVICIMSDEPPTFCPLVDVTSRTSGLAVEFKKKKKKKVGKTRDYWGEHWGRESEIKATMHVVKLQETNTAAAAAVVLLFPISPPAHTACCSGADMWMSRAVLSCGCWWQWRWFTYHNTGAVRLHGRLCPVTATWSAARSFRKRRKTGCVLLSFDTLCPPEQVYR